MRGLDIRKIKEKYLENGGRTIEQEIQVAESGKQYRENSRKHEKNFI